ncbi:uncharacterized protein LOC141649201 [Silene latifolia]|uniref:uncharacterized protein LOC141649201 n=1 Tax=Silene latifolia TaxID=37657 RepID=UPI003D771F6A
MEQYWCATLLIPKGVHKLITKFCRNFLWQPEDGKRKMIMKSWSSCCAPYQEGGYNIKEILSWNKCIICKWIWAIETKSESVWAAWNYKYNIKNEDFWAMEVKPHHSESWRSILLVKNELITRTGSIAEAKQVLFRSVQAGKLNLSLLYDYLRVPAVKISWAKGVWNTAVLPKHGFIMVLAVQGKLATVDKLNQKGQCIVNRCILCKKDNESHQHLFFKCSFASTVWIGVLQWLRMSYRTRNMRKELQWIARFQKRKHWKARLYSSSLAATVYCLWEERNCRLFREEEHSSEYILKRIQYVVSVRLLFVTNSRYKNEVVDYLQC